MGQTLSPHTLAIDADAHLHQAGPLDGIFKGSQSELGAQGPLKVNGTWAPNSLKCF